MEKKTAKYWINKLHLEKHPEGGFYRRIYESSIKLDDTNLPFSFQGERHLATSIYYLLGGNEVSVFHKLNSDEIWYFQYGSSATIHIINEKGEYFKKIIGPDVKQEFDMQVIIPANCIFAAEINEKESYGLFGCIVAPGFDFADFEIIERRFLLDKYPKQAALIQKFTK